MDAHPGGLVYGISASLRLARAAAHRLAPRRTAGRRDSRVSARVAERLAPMMAVTITRTSDDGQLEKLPGDGHEAARWRSARLLRVAPVHGGGAHVAAVLVGCEVLSPDLLRHAYQGALACAGASAPGRAERKGELPALTAFSRAALLARCKRHPGHRQARCGERSPRVPGRSVLVTRGFSCPAGRPPVRPF
jgi:hypothetical protein